MFTRDFPIINPLKPSSTPSGRRHSEHVTRAWSGVLAMGIINWDGNSTEKWWFYPLVNVNKKLWENHHFSWENSLFLWPEDQCTDHGNSWDLLLESPPHRLGFQVATWRSWSHDTSDFHDLKRSF